MEYVHGGNLYDYLKLGEERGLFFTEAQVSYIIHEAVKAIEFLHSLDRIHRDIKVSPPLTHWYLCKTRLTTSLCLPLEMSS